MSRIYCTDNNFLSEPMFGPVRGTASVANQIPVPREANVFVDDFLRRKIATSPVSSRGKNLKNLRNSTLVITGNRVELDEQSSRFSRPRSIRAEGATAAENLSRRSSESILAVEFPRNRGPRERCANCWPEESNFRGASGNGTKRKREEF